jgi:hypothetical protein
MTAGMRGNPINTPKEWTEYMRWITPILVTIALFFLVSISNKVDSIDEKLFKHLTNDEIHTPKSIAISRAEFSIYQDLRAKQMEDLATNQRELKELLREHDRNTTGGRR